MCSAVRLDPPSDPGSARGWPLSSHLRVGMTIVAALRWQVRPAWTWGSPVRRSLHRMRCGSECAADQPMRGCGRERGACCGSPRRGAKRESSPHTPLPHIIPLPLPLRVAPGMLEPIVCCCLSLTPVCLRTCRSLVVDLDAGCAWLHWGLHQLAGGHRVRLHCPPAWPQ